MTSEQHTATTDALEIAYEASGPRDGAPVVLLHGFPYDVRAYDDVAATLAVDGCRVIVPYLRGHGPTRFRQPDRMRSGQQGAIGDDLRGLLDALGVEPAVLVGYDWGGRAACITAALWPQLVRGLVTVGGYNIQNIARAGNPLPPEFEHRFWYQYYFHSERGRAGLRRHRRELTRLLWELWSPTWAFDDATFEHTAVSFDNEDYVDVVIHSYRHRFDLVAGDSAYDDIEARLALQPDIGVPTVVLLGTDDGVDPFDPDDLDDARNFGHLLAARAVAHAGHNLPQEQPGAVVDAVRELLAAT